MAKQVRWNPPPRDCLKLNSDGLVLNHFKASYRGIIRDHNDNFVLGYNVNLGTCTITQAEVGGVLYGLHLAVNLDSSNLLMKVNSNCAVLFCQNSTSDFHACRLLVFAIH